MWSSRPMTARDGGPVKRTLHVKNYSDLGLAERDVLRDILSDTVTMTFPNYGEISVPGIVRSSISSYGPRYSQGLKHGFYIVLNNNPTTSDVTSCDAITYVRTRLIRYPKIKVEEIPYLEEHEHTVCYFADPWTHPTPWDLYVQDNFQDVEVVNKILRRRPEVWIGCFLANGQLGNTQCLSMIQSNSTSCQKHFEDIYRAMQVAQHLPYSQQKLVYSFCLNYMRPCVHEMKNLVIVAIYINFPRIIGREPYVDEVKEASRLQSEYDNNQANWIDCHEMVMSFCNLHIRLTEFCYQLDLLSDASNHIRKAISLLAPMPEDTLKADLRTSLNRFMDILSPASPETSPIVGGILNVLCDTQMIISPGWCGERQVSTETDAVFSDGVRLDTLIGVQPSTHLITCEYNDNVLIKVNVIRDPFLESENEEGYENEAEEESELNHNVVGGSRNLQTIMEVEENSDEDISNIFLSRSTAVLDLSDSEEEEDEEEERGETRYEEITDGSNHKFVCFENHVHSSENCLLEAWLKKIFNIFVDSHFPNERSKERVKLNTNQETKDFFLSCICQSASEANVFIFSNSNDANNRNHLEKIIKKEHQLSEIVTVDSSDEDEDEILASGG